MMRRFALPSALLFALLAAPIGAQPQNEKAGPALEFEDLFIKFEVNETDGDAEVLMFAKAPEGMDRFQVIGPNGERRVYLQSLGSDDLGQAQILVESAEPSIQAVKRAYPVGVYKFFGRTVSGQQVSGRVRLSHKLLPAPSFTPHEEEGLDPDDVVVSWTPVPGAVGYQVEIEQDEIGANLTMTVGPGVSSLPIPAGFLEPGTEYEIGVATITSQGNVAVAESSFTTAD